MQFQIESRDGVVTIPASGQLRLQSGRCGLFPFSLELGEAHLIYATVQPLSILRDAAGRECFVFFAPEGIAPELCFDAHTIVSCSGAPRQRDGNRLIVRTALGLEGVMLQTQSGEEVRVLVLSRSDAEGALVRRDIQGDHLFLSEADCWFEEGNLEIRSTGHVANVRVFPALAAGVSLPLEATMSLDKDSSIVSFQTQPKLIEPHREDRSGWVVLRFAPDLFEGVDDVWLRVNYEGDTAGAYVNGTLVADNFCNGQTWEIALRRLGPDVLEHELCLRFSPLQRGEARNTSTAMAARLDFEGDELLRIHDIECAARFRFHLPLSA